MAQQTADYRTEHTLVHFHSVISTYGLRKYGQIRSLVRTISVLLRTISLHWGEYSYIFDYWQDEVKTNGFATSAKYKIL